MKSRYNIQVETPHNQCAEVIVRINRATSRYVEQQFEQVLIVPIYDIYDLLRDFNNDEGKYVERFKEAEMHELAALPANVYSPLVQSEVATDDAVPFPIDDGNDPY